MRVYFYFSVFEPLFGRVAEDLRARYGVSEIGGFVWGHDQRKQLDRLGVRPWRLDVFSDWTHRLPAWKTDETYLRAAEARYGNPSLTLMAYGDRFLARRRYPDVLKLLEMSLRTFEDLLDRDRPDAIVFESIDGLVTNVLHAVATSRGVPCLAIEAGGRVSGRSLVYRDARQRWTQVEEIFERISRHSLPDESAREARALLDRYREGRAKPPYPALYPRINSRDLARFARGSLRYFEDRSNITLTSPGRMIAQRALRLVRHIGSRWLRYFERPVPGEKYVLFPLHFQPESTTLVCAPYYVDQLSLIEDVAKSLPIGYRLYVKEHFASVGRRPLSHYRRIRALWNVRLLAPFEDSYRLIEAASVVASINSTMGWEALLLGRPVVSFGEVFYNTYPRVIQAGRAPKAEWPNVFRQAIDQPPLDEGLLLKFLAAILEASTSLPVYLDNPRTNPLVITDDNVRNITDLLAHAMGLHASPTPIHLAGG